MPSHPFQPHPTFAEYLHWAEQQGCSVNTGHVSTVPFIRITHPATGRIVVQGGVEQTEYLTPSIVARLDRRLGLVSPWNPGFPDE